MVKCGGLGGPYIMLPHLGRSNKGPPLEAHTCMRPLCTTLIIHDNAGITGIIAGSFQSALGAILNENGI